MIGYELVLFGIGLLWLIAAVVFDIKTKEVPNWLNFSLIIVALVFRMLYSVLAWDYWPFLNGVIGAVIFFALANLFYYFKLFGGGDAKLFFALGAVIGVSHDWVINFVNYSAFVLLLLVLGFIYGILASGLLIAKNWNKRGREIKKEFSKEYNSKKILIFLALLLFIAALGVLYRYNMLILLPFFALLALTPLMWAYARTIENTLMVKKVLTGDLKEGDWLYKDVKLKNGKIVKSNFDGLTKGELLMLRKNFKEVRIKEGVVFVPAFLMAYLAYVWLWYSGWGFLALSWLF